MKKRTGILIGIALGCIVLGLALSGIGLAAGGSGQLARINGYFGWKAVDKETAETEEEALQNWGSIGNWSKYNGEKETSDQEILNGDFIRKMPCPDTLAKLDICIGVHDLRIVESRNNEIVLTGENCDRIQCFIKDDKLVLKDVGKNKKYRQDHSRTLTLEIPVSLQWKDADLETAMGNLEIETLAAEKVELEADMGLIQVERVNADKLEAQAAMGSVVLSDCSIGKVGLTADMGSIEFTGSLSGDLEAEASMGSIRVYLHGQEKDFNYDIEASMGSVNLNGNEYSGLDKSREIENKASQKMELNASMGSIEISFR